MLLIDYFVRVVAENGQGEILTVVQDMPSLPRAVTLPEVSNLISDYKELVQELGKTSREITQERKSRDEEKKRVAEAEAIKAKERAEQEAKEKAEAEAAAAAKAAAIAANPALAAAKYFKMLKMGLPRGAVEQKMIADGLDPALLDAPPVEEAPPAPAAAAGSDVAKYKKMLKMGLPRGAVEQKMAADGLDPALLDAPDEPAPPPAPPAPPAPAATGGASAAKYKKMLKMGLPRGAVEQKMAADGLDPALLDAPDEPTPPPAPDAHMEGAAAAVNSKLDEWRSDPVSVFKAIDANGLYGITNTTTVGPRPQASARSAISTLHPLYSVPTTRPPPPRPSPSHRRPTLRPPPLAPPQVMARSRRRRS